MDVPGVGRGGTPGLGAGHAVAGFQTEETSPGSTAPQPAPWVAEIDDPGGGLRRLAHMGFSPGQQGLSSAQRSCVSVATDSSPRGTQGTCPCPQGSLWARCVLGEPHILWRESSDPFLVGSSTGWEVLQAQEPLTLLSPQKKIAEPAL